MSRSWSRLGLERKGLVYIPDFGYPEVNYIRHVVGNGNLRTMPDKTEKLAQSPVPKTKKQLRSFLGLADYYRKFVRNYATMAVPLTDMTRGGSPNMIPRLSNNHFRLWSECYAQSRFFVCRMYNGHSYFGLMLLTLVLVEYYTAETRRWSTAGRIHQQKIV